MNRPMRDQAVEEGAFPEDATLLYVIGAQKAGTTWLNHYLQSHPDCHIRRGEVHYFEITHGPEGRGWLNSRLQQIADLAQELKHRRGEKFARTRATLSQFVEHAEIFEGRPGDHSRYLSYLSRGWQGERVIADVSPSYIILDRTAFGAMAGLAPKTSFVLILRDPIDRFWSSIRMIERRRGVAKDFAERCADRAWSALDRRVQEHMLRSDYGRVIGELEAVGLGPRAHYFFYEDLFQAATIKRLCGALDIPYVEASFTVEKNAGVPASLDEQLARRMYAKFAPIYEAMADRFGNALPARWREHMAAYGAPSPAVG
ncbi:MAG: sulfotransferase [Pseudomonadota bacterium]